MVENPDFLTNFLNLIFRKGLLRKSTAILVYFGTQLRPRNPTCPSTFLCLAYHHRSFPLARHPANKSLWSYPRGGLIRGPIKKRGPKEPLIYRSGSRGRKKQLLFSVSILAPRFLPIKINDVDLIILRDIHCSIFDP